MSTATSPQPNHPSAVPVYPGTEAPTADESGLPPVVWSDAVADPDDPLDVAASPDAWLSPRALLGLTVGVGIVLLATLVIAWLYWSTPAVRPVPVPRVDQV